jgi:hypothetical protein
MMMMMMMIEENTADGDGLLAYMARGLLQIHQISNCSALSLVGRLLTPLSVRLK